MYMRIIWGRIVSGQWDGFEAAYKKATSLRGDVKGLKNQWLARDQADPDAGYSITLWESEADMRAFWDSKKREEARWLCCSGFSISSPLLNARFGLRKMNDQGASQTRAPRGSRPAPRGNHTVEQ